MVKLKPGVKSAWIYVDFLKHDKVCHAAYTRAANLIGLPYKINKVLHWLVRWVTLLRFGWICILIYLPPLKHDKVLPRCISRAANLIGLAMLHIPGPQTLPVWPHVEIFMQF